MCWIHCVLVTSGDLTGRYLNSYKERELQQHSPLAIFTLLVLENCVEMLGRVRACNSILVPDKKGAVRVIRFEHFNGLSVCTCLAVARCCHVLAL